MSRQPVLDQAAVLARVGGDAELLKELVGLFLAECPKLLSEMREAVARGDAKALARAAHALRGSVSNFEEGDVFDVVLRLEEMGREGLLTHAEEAYAALEEGIARLQPALATLGKEAAG